MEEKEILDHLFQPILAQGVLGILSVTFAYVIRVLFKMYVAAQNQRIIDGIESQKRLHEATLALRELMGPKK